MQAFYRTWDPSVMAPTKGVVGMVRRQRSKIVSVVLALLVAASGVPAAASAGAHPAVEVQFDWLYYVETPEGPAGGTQWGAVGVSANPTGRLRVAFFEELSGGAGLSSRAAGWMAAVVASTILGVDMFDYTLSFEMPGYSDGPSAGALMTAALAAALLGHSILPHATMTGTIQPDGTIGPVGGIAQKIEGAAEAGKTLVLIPFGQRMEVDLETGALIDLVAHGARLGVTVREVSDIYQAYRLLTGHQLRPQPRMPSEEELALSPAAFEALRYEYEKLNERLSLRAEELEAQDHPLSAEAWHTARQAFQTMLEGNGPVAWNLMLEAVSLAEAQQVVGEVVALVGESRQTVDERLTAWREVGDRLDAFVEEIRRLEPRSMGGVAGLLQAHGMAARARELLDFADLLANQAMEHFPTAEYAEQNEGVRESGPSGENVAHFDGRDPVLTEENPWTAAMHLLIEAGILYRSVDLMREAAEDMLAIGIVDDDLGSDPPAPERVERLGLLFRAGALAGMEYFERVVVDDIAEALEVHPGEARWRLITEDYDYAMTLGATVRLSDLSTGNPYVLLGTAGSVFNDVGTLITSYYSLDALKDDGVVVSVERPGLLVELLRWAEREAAIAIAAAHEVGVVPTVSQILFQMARHQSHQSLHKQVGALRLFWQAGFLARTAVWLSNEPARLGPAAAAE